MKFNGERVVTGDMRKYIPTLQEHIARYNFALQPVLNKTVLDAACGTGYGSKLLTETAATVTGLDISQDACLYAASQYPDIPFIQCDLNKDFPDKKFDLCVSFETIEHLEKPDVFLQNVENNCKEFIFSIPVNAPGDYHLQVWSNEEIQTMMHKYFSKITWFNQRGTYIYTGADNALFLIGVATN